MDKQYSIQTGSGPCLGKMTECLGIGNPQVYPYRPPPEESKFPDRELHSYIEFYKEQIIRNRQLPKINMEKKDDYYYERMKAMKERKKQQNEQNPFLNLPNDVLAIIFDNVNKRLGTSPLLRRLLISSRNDSFTI
jgi:hypothetical protein